MPQSIFLKNNLFDSDFYFNVNIDFLFVTVANCRVAYGVDIC